MVKVYVDLIKVGLWDIDNVPSLWKADVQALLEKETGAE
ncbi:CD1375 family protein [Cytobacillus purgationiresistens]|uniref:Uncharacterized protein n=1 Tax=Cytobacillus purgationiresistens TaxID=863449 RepID=A0ABU0ADP6_9BACI|nr:CD1375 family protein [Cytobacillus purgationiresistens]MDQ0268866.1 hypothetical protein [Cytobacillus purgationiresistens]